MRRLEGAARCAQVLDVRGLVRAAALGEKIEERIEVGVATELAADLREAERGEVRARDVIGEIRRREL